MKVCSAIFRVPWIMSYFGHLFNTLKNESSLCMNFEAYWWVSRLAFRFRLVSTVQACDAVDEFLQYSYNQCLTNLHVRNQGFFEIK
jgi:hypothetical protein